MRGTLWRIGTHFAVDGNQYTQRSHSTHKTSGRWRWLWHRCHTIPVFQQTFSSTRRQILPTDRKVTQSIDLLCLQQTDKAAFSCSIKVHSKGLSVDINRVPAQWITSLVYKYSYRNLQGVDRFCPSCTTHCITVWRNTNLKCYLSWAWRQQTTTNSTYLLTVSMLPSNQNIHYCKTFQSRLIWTHSCKRTQSTSCGSSSPLFRQHCKDSHTKHRGPSQSGQNYCTPCLYRHARQ